MSHLSTNFCPCTMRMINDFNFVCSTHICYSTTLDKGLYYYGILVNEGIGLIIVLFLFLFLFLVIQTFYPCALSVLYYKDVCPTFSLDYINTIISFLYSMLFNFTDIKFYIYLCTFQHLPCVDFNKPCAVNS